MAGMHSHDHEHEAPDYNRAFAWGVTLNVLYIVVEVVFGLMAGSLALLADAGHNLSDVLGLVFSWVAHRLCKSSSTPRRTYGMRRMSILAALGNALFLLIAIGAIAGEAIHRLMRPQPSAGLTIMWVAAGGVLINAATAWLFASGRKGDLNIRSAFLHMAADAAVSLGVLAAGAIIYFTGALWVDPIISLVVAAVIAVGTWGLLRESTALALDAVPKTIDPSHVQHYLAGLPGVCSVHHLHIWGMSTTETALTAHLVKPDAQIDDELLSRIDRELREQFDIHHATIQFERTDARCEEISADAATAAAAK
jgi:cobalt-zinc-cadmium efflux system protein